MRGNWVVKRKTSGKRLSRALRAIKEWCRGNRHKPLAERQKTLSQKIRGHPEPEDQRALRLLRDHGQQPSAVAVPPLDSASLAQVAQSAQSRADDDLGTV